LSPEIADKLRGELSLAPFRLGDLPWIEVSYDGLTHSLASVDINGQEVPLLGYSDTRQGRAYFLGLNLFAHILENRDPKAQQLIETLLDMRSPNKQLYPAAVEDAVIVRKNDQMNITYFLRRDSPVIISESYSPHWQATLDGKPLPIYNYENLLMTFLPAGSGTVTLDYKLTTVQWISWAISALGLMAMVIALTHGWHRFLRMKEWRLSDLGGRSEVSGNRRRP
ncbi:MAG: hypothetical protein Q8P00_03270, partial [Dehalococcoidia bacterium]|nr:hypothetical protein [Dehalococcoidia bacterium]